MNPTIEATVADHIPADAEVYHYDQLTGDAKHALPVAVANGSADVPWRAAEQFASIDVVKFTSYYHVRIAGTRESTDRTAAPAASTVDVDPPPTIRELDRRSEEPLPE